MEIFSKRCYFPRQDATYPPASPGVSLESCIKSYNTVWKKRNDIFDPDWPMIYHREHDDGDPIAIRSSCTCHIKSFHLRKVAYLRATGYGNVIRTLSSNWYHGSCMNTFFITCANPIESNRFLNLIFSFFLWRTLLICILYLLEKCVVQRIIYFFRWWERNRCSN